MASSSTIPEAIAARAALINGNFQISDEQKQFMNLVRTALAEAAAKIVNGLPASNAALPQVKQYDVGRIIAGLDAMQASKDILCAAAILPAYRPPAQ